MQNARENLHGLWRSHKGLMVLLFVGLTISLLAVLAPQAWATPGQRVLGQTITDVTPEPPDDGFCYRACDEAVEIRSATGAFTDTGPTTATVYITPNALWMPGTTTGTNISEVGYIHSTVVSIDDTDTFDPNPVTIWEPPLEVGCWDIFIDVNNDGIFNNSDAVIDPDGPTAEDECINAGICVDPCPVGGVTVPCKALVAAPYLVAALVVGVGGVAALVHGRRRR